MHYQLFFKCFIYVSYLPLGAIQITYTAKYAKLKQKCFSRTANGDFTPNLMKRLVVFALLFVCVQLWIDEPLFSHKHTKSFNVEEIESPKFEDLWGWWKFFATNETKTKKNVDQNVLATKRYLSFFLMIKSTLLFSTIYFISKSYFSTKIWLEFFQFFLLLSMTSFWCFYCFKFEYILHLFLVFLLLTLNK